MGCIRSKQLIKIDNQYQTTIPKSSVVHNEQQILNSHQKQRSSKNFLNLSEHNTQSIKIQNLITKNNSTIKENYEILSIIGKGSFGQVYKVLHLSTGIIRAMKIIRISNVKLQDDDNTFLREIEILIKLQHPNIIKIYEYYEDDINYYLITEYVSGGELYEAISKFKSFNEQQAKYIMKQLLLAINYLHSNNIVHRDIKPENILVEQSSNENTDSSTDMINIKLIDFGTCNYINNHNFTLKVGSPYYIAPEVLKKNYNSKCDVWSAGVMLFFLLVGYCPFKGKTTEQLFENISKGKYDINCKEWASISDEAKSLVTKMLDPNMKTRFTANQCLEHQWLHSFVPSKLLSETHLIKNNDIINNILGNITNFNAKEKLQQATMAYIIHFLYSSQELEELKKLFVELDTNGDGKLSYDELQMAFKHYFGSSVSQMKLNKILEEINGDGNDCLSYEEFLRISLNQTKLLNETNLKMAFDRFDDNKDGKLSKDEIKNILGLSNTEYVNQLIQLIDENKDGFVSFEEFKELMNELYIDTKRS